MQSCTAPVHCPPVRTLLARHRSILFGLCSLLLLAQFSGAHLHLCFDGQEPPIQLHLLDANEGHDETEFSRPHSDEEIVLNGDSSTRNDSLQIDLPPTISGTLAAGLSRVTALAATLSFDAILPCAAHRELLPPPRGPPATA